MRSRIAALVVVALASFGLGTSPAAAGSFASTTCSDGSGGIEVPLLVSPITVGMEIRTGSSTTVDICYASSPVNHSGSELIGGRISISRFVFGADQAVAVQCLSDSSTTVTSDCLGVASVLSNGTVVAHLFWGTIDTTLTSPTTLPGTGAAVFSPLGGDVMLPCVMVNWTHLVPTCGTPLV